MFDAPLPPLFPPPPLPAPAMPVGAVVAFAGTLGPPQPNGSSPQNNCGESGDYSTDPVEAWGWMFCDGRTLSRDRYPELFQVLGYRYGGSDSDFRIPDYRGYFLRGTDCGRQLDPNRSERKDAAGYSSEQVGSTQEDALQCHRHSYVQPKGETSAQPGSGTAVAAAVPDQCTGYPDEKVCNSGVKTSEEETRPVNIYVNYLIKFTYGPWPCLVTISSHRDARPEWLLPATERSNHEQ